MSLLVLLVLVAACGASEATDNAEPAMDEGGTTADGAVSAPSFLELVRAKNDLTRENHALYCERCPCGEFLDVDPATEECVAALTEQYPEVLEVAVQSYTCEIAAQAEEQTCFSSSTDCPQADACVAARQSAFEECANALPMLDQGLLMEYEAAAQRAGCGSE